METLEQLEQKVEDKLSDILKLSLKLTKKGKYIAQVDILANTVSLFVCDKKDTTIKTIHFHRTYCLGFHMRLSLITELTEYEQKLH